MIGKCIVLAEKAESVFTRQSCTDLYIFNLNNAFPVAEAHAQKPKFASEFPHQWPILLAGMTNGETVTNILYERINS